jgi:hypothetical protein
VVHCHPPHATAFAITGAAPPNGYVAEYEYFIGTSAVAPYETPGTQAFAETVIPFVCDHNTILLANHGVVCWSDTVTHAEWLVEILDTYCRTWVIAGQMGGPCSRFRKRSSGRFWSRSAGRDCRMSGWVVRLNTCLNTARSRGNAITNFKPWSGVSWRSSSERSELLFAPSLLSLGAVCC